MRKRVVHKSKIEGVKHIDNANIDIFLTHSSSGIIKSFSIEKIDLSGLDIPEDALVWLWCTSSYDEKFYDLGSAGNMQLLGEQSLEGFDVNSPIYFRINIFLKSDPKLLASSNNIRPRNSDEEAGSISLLRVQVVKDLGDRLWQLEGGEDEPPYLKVNENIDINMAQRLEDDWLVRGLILPEAISQVLFKIVGDYDPTKDWHINWNKFVKKHGLNLEELDSEEDNSEKVQAVVDQWCRQLSLCKAICSFIEERS